MWRAGHRLLLAAPRLMARIEDQRRGYKVRDPQTATHLGSRHE
jgi:hypothetical protein